MGLSCSNNKVRLIMMLFLTSGYFLVEITVGYMTNSMALVADSFHMLSDVAALIIAFVAILVSDSLQFRNSYTLYVLSC
jgi:zinc transporter 1